MLYTNKLKCFEPNFQSVLSINKVSLPLTPHSFMIIGIQPVQSKLSHPKNRDICLYLESTLALVPPIFKANLVKTIVCKDIIANTNLYKMSLRSLRHPFKYSCICLSNALPLTLVAIARSL